MVVVHEDHKMLAEKIVGSNPRRGNVVRMEGRTEESVRDIMDHKRLLGILTMSSPVRTSSSYQVSISCRDIFPMPEASVST